MPRLLALLFCAAMFAHPALGQTTIFSDGFESGNFSAWSGRYGPAPDNTTDTTINSVSPLAGSYDTTIHYWQCGNPQTDEAKYNVITGTTAGGALGARTYYIKYSFGDATTNETLLSAEATQAVGANNLLTMQAPVTMYPLTGYWVYVGTSSGAETKQGFVLNGQTWTEPVTGLVAGDAPNTTVTGCGSSSADKNRRPYVNFTQTTDHIKVGHRVRFNSPINGGSKKGSQRKLWYIAQTNFGTGWQISLTSDGCADLTHLSLRILYQDGGYSFTLYGAENELGLNPAGQSPAPCNGIFDFHWDQTYLVETELRSNQALGGTATPIMKIWVDGVLVFQKTSGWATPCVPGTSYSTCNSWPTASYATKHMGDLELGAQTSRGNYIPFDEIRQIDDAYIQELDDNPTVAPTSLSFGTQNTGTTSAAQTVTLTNLTSSPLTISSIALTTGTQFAITNNCSSPLAAGDFCTVDVTFSPTTAGAKADTLTFTHSASNSPQTVSLSGTGQTPSTPAPAITTFTASPYPGVQWGASMTITLASTDATSCTAVARWHAQSGPVHSEAIAGCNPNGSFTWTPSMFRNYDSLNVTLSGDGGTTDAVKDTPAPYVQQVVAGVAY